MFSKFLKILSVVMLFGAGAHAYAEQGITDTEIIHTNEKHCVHDFKMALLVIRKASKTAHRSKDSFSPEERRNLRLVLGGLARPATTVNRR